MWFVVSFTFVFARWSTFIAADPGMLILLVTSARRCCIASSRDALQPRYSYFRFSAPCSFPGYFMACCYSIHDCIILCYLLPCSRELICCFQPLVRLFYSLAFLALLPSIFVGFETFPFSSIVYCSACFAAAAIVPTSSSSSSISRITVAR